MEATLFICNCCGRICQSQTQVYDHPAMRNRSLTQVECMTPGCNNEFWTLTYSAGGDNSQLTDRYTPVTMDAGQVGRFVEACDFTAKAS